MNNLRPTSLPIALRVYPRPHVKGRSGSSNRRDLPDVMLIVDTETSIDETQRLKFGSYRFIDEAGLCIEEGLFYAGDLPDNELQTLQQYAATHNSDTAHHRNRNLPLLTCRQFVKKLYRYGYKRRCLVVAFNFPFDVSRVAFNFTEGRRDFAGGFSLEIWPYTDDAGSERHNPQR